MVLDDLAPRERRGIAAVFAVAVAAAFAAGYVGSDVLGSPTGAISGDASADEIGDNVQQLMDQQMQTQEAQLATMAEQSEDISVDDLSMDATVSDVSASDIDGLVEVTVSISGQMPSQQNPGELESVDQEQVVYVSADGQYLFPEPTPLNQDMMQQAPQGQEPAPQQPPQ